MNNDHLTPAFLYGESVFTTLKVVNGAVIDRYKHLERLSSNIEKYFQVKSSKDILDRVNHAWPKDLGSGALRISITSEVRDNLLSFGDELDLKISFSFRELDFSKSVGPYKLLLVKRVQDSALDELKIGSYGKEFYLKRKAIAKGYDDILFYGENKVFETSTSNIFFKKDEILYTAKEGIYKGLTREKLINSQNVVTRDIFIDELENFDEIFLTNSIYSKILVSKIEE